VPENDPAEGSRVEDGSSAIPNADEFTQTRRLPATTGFKHAVFYEVLFGLPGRRRDGSGD